MGDQLKPDYGDSELHEAVVQYVVRYCKERKITHPEDIISAYDDARRAVEHVFQVVKNRE